MAILTYRNRDGELVDLPLVAATRLKNDFGAVFDEASLHGAVAITKHNTPKAVLLSIAEFEALTSGAVPELDDLCDEFDALLAAIQTTRAKAGTAAAFDASPTELGEAAVRAARPKRR